jgi:hypothetical protein
MNTNQSNDSFQSVRVSCSKAKMRLFLLASLPCLIGSAWAQSLSVGLSMSDALVKIKGTLIVSPAPPFNPGITPVNPGPVNPGIMPSAPVGKPANPGAVLPAPPVK